MLAIAHTGVGTLATITTTILSIIITAGDTIRITATGADSTLTTTITGVGIIIIILLLEAIAILLTVIMGITTMVSTATMFTEIRTEFMVILLPYQPILASTQLTVEELLFNNDLQLIQQNLIQLRCEKEN